jgi:hypothetical protein
MGMSTHVIGFKPPDEKWKSMKIIYDQCEKMGVPIPDEVEEFFGWDIPDEAGVQVSIPTQRWHDGNSQSGYELKVEDIPKDIKTIRFFNAW